MGGGDGDDDERVSDDAIYHPVEDTTQQLLVRIRSSISRYIHIVERTHKNK
jgi:hypothetical protein